MGRAPSSRMAVRSIAQVALIALLLAGCAKSDTHNSTSGTMSVARGSTTAATTSAVTLRVEITAPAASFQVSPGTPVVLEGRALDAAGSVVSASLSWSSSIDGALGAGSPLTVSALTPG